MHKKIDLDDSVYKLCTLHPELKAVMKDAGFQNITKPGMLETAGRIMTIPKGARMMQIEWNHVLDILKAHGFDPVWKGEKQ
ncbi:DUF1858 domain-containing protein [Bacillus sp. GM2]|uniref:DUF1858 domain-containing protein n=2 Tax=Bacillus licheniformis TaxID=1402 RepID=Q65IZ8_BACLD|nr:MULTISPECIES: DUF1858 domain-containing protein [Bacillus]MBJ7884906.1 DUF1858 domain-containing protein [Bacillaceae bacterium HSR45]MBY8346693.1 DUF1858 domain-containing protein [Bacillus sp. PCH94]MDP4079351.1 DUF1858 domain-containing protein [Bacillota bacterium]AAU23602.1 hypothetical protein BL01170 [Bacillus licheniformis DSM 13 = ATCC 14580]AAU40966.1 hypothetical protein BLi02076 [Bacillus licheniformis DSM 13 = ATCC 14580]